MKDIKERSVVSCQIWKEAGRPRSGPVFDIYRKDKSAYKRELRANKGVEKEIYTNDLHEAVHGTVGHPNLDRLEVVLLVLVVLLTILLLLISLRSTLLKFAQIILCQELTA